MTTHLTPEDPRAEDRAWTLELDAAACKALDLDPALWTVFLISNQVDYADTALQEAEDEFEDEGYIDISDVLSFIQDKMVHVDMPPGWRMVGLRQFGDEEPKNFKYALVDLSSQGWK